MRVFIYALSAFLSGGRGVLGPTVPRHRAHDTNAALHAHARRETNMHVLQCSLVK